MKKIKMFVCVGNTTHYKEIFEKVLEEFVDRFEKEGIIGEYSVFSQTDIEATKLSESQLVLFITEEQGHEMEESMKVFLQNVSLWSYTMPMVGKLGILVSVCNEKELLITTNYMTKLMLAWGSGIVGKLIFQNGISVEAELAEQIDIIAEKIKKICDRVSFKVTEAQKKNFEINKKMISGLDDSEYLKQYWEENMYLEAKDFQYLFDSKFLA